MSTNNGDVTFGSAYSGFSGLNLAAFGSPIVAVAFFDVDTRAPATTPVSHGPITYAGRPAYCVNWVNVGYFNNGADRLNSSQLVLVDRSETGAGNFDLVMNYDQSGLRAGRRADRRLLQRHLHLRVPRVRVAGRSPT